jgi:hypothetical protein
MKLHSKSVMYAVRTSPRTALDKDRSHSTEGRIRYISIFGAQNNCRDDLQYSGLGRMFGASHINVWDFDWILRLGCSKLVSNTVFQLTIPITEMLV